MSDRDVVVLCATVPAEALRQAVQAEGVIAALAAFRRLALPRGLDRVARGAMIAAGPAGARMKAEGVMGRDRQA